MTTIYEVIIDFDAVIDGYPEHTAYKASFDERKTNWEQISHGGYEEVPSSWVPKEVKDLVKRMRKAANKR